MNNYMNNSIQYDNNILTNQQLTNIYPSNKIQNTNLFNQSSTYPSIKMDMINDNLSNQEFDPMILNGTNLDDEHIFNSNSLNQPKQDSTLIKSVAREIINGLNENKMSLYDNSSINSYKATNTDEYYQDTNDDNYSSSSQKKSKSSKSKNKIKEVVETIEDFISDNKSNNSVKTYSYYAGWFFDDCFNYKDFIVLFILYFVLSQEMIKDFFAKYFSSLNPDNEGKVGVQGVIIYGLILTILFMIIKKIF